MSAHDDELNSVLDQLVRRQRLSSSTSESDLAPTASRFVSAAKPTPDPGFAARLEQTLMDHSPTPTRSALVGDHRGIALPRTPQPASWQTWTHRRRAWGVVSVFVAVVLLVVAFGDVVRRGDGPSTIVAPVGFASPSIHSATVGDCTIDPTVATDLQNHLTDTYVQLTTTLPQSTRYLPSSPNQPSYIWAASDLPTGVEPDAATRAAVLQRLAIEVQCFTTRGLGTPVTDPTLPLEPASVPDVLSMTVLADGRVGVLLASDFSGLGTELYFTFAPYQGSWGAWIGDSILIVMPDAWLLSTASVTPRSSAPISIFDVYIAPPTERVITARPGTTIQVANKGSRAHTFTIPSLGVAVTIQPNQVVDVPLAVPPGGYTYHVDIDDPSETPGVGKIWVVNAESATPIATAATKAQFTWNAPH